jgi:hypothetical protein
MVGGKKWMECLQEENGDTLKVRTLCVADILFCKRRRCSFSEQKSSSIAI